MSTVERVIGYLLALYSIKDSSIPLQASIDNHMESPSMLTLQDVLFEYGIESASVRKVNFTSEDVEAPVISLIQQEEWSQSAITIKYISHEREN